MSIICDGIISSCGDTEAYLATSDSKTINGGVTFTNTVVVQGSITTDATFSGDGSLIFALNASNLASGTVPFSRLVNTQTVGNANATIANGTRDILLTTALTAARVYTLPYAASYPAGTRITFCDLANTLTSVNTATLASSGSDTINGATTIVLSTAGAAPMLICDGAGRWNIDIRGVARGGTGISTITSGNILTGNGTGALTSITPGTGVAAALGANTNATGGIATPAGIAGGTLPASFTTLAASGATTITNSTASVSPTTGALIVTGGIGVGGRIRGNNDLTCAATAQFEILGRAGIRSSATGEIQFRDSGNTANANITFANGTATGAIIPGSFTFATRPTVATGGIVTITDGASATPGVIAAGGGSNNIAIRFNGTNWIVL